MQLGFADMPMQPPLKLMLTADVFESHTVATWHCCAVVGNKVACNGGTTDNTTAVSVMLPHWASPTASLMQELLPW
jgi:hypothetical protein